LISVCERIIGYGKLTSFLYAVMNWAIMFPVALSTQAWIVEATIGEDMLRSIYPLTTSLRIERRRESVVGVARKTLR
jgi:hypothetical protein